MSVITDEMDRLKKVSIENFKNKINPYGEMSKSEIQIFEFGYCCGRDDARRIQETIKTLAKEAIAEHERN